jgi:hypothetical protein
VEPGRFQGVARVTSESIEEDWLSSGNLSDGCFSTSAWNIGAFCSNPSASKRPDWNSLRPDFNLKVSTQAATPADAS